METQKKTKLVSIFVYGLSGVAFAIGLFFAWRITHQDFAYFYHAFRVVITPQPNINMYDHQSINDWLIQKGFLPHKHAYYTYPPQFAVLFGWIGFIPLSVAVKMWSALGLVAYGYSAWLLYRTSDLRSPTARRLFFVSAVTNLPFWWDFLIGNSNWLVLTMVLLSVYWVFKKEKGWIGGIFLGVAVMVKLTPVLLFLPMVFYRKWKGVTGAVATILAGTTLTALVVGIEPLFWYAQNLSKIAATTMKTGPAPYNSSLEGVLGWYNKAGVVHVSSAWIHHAFDVYLVVMMGFVLWVLFRASQSGRNQIQKSTLAMGIMSILLISPLIEGPHLLLAWPALWLLWNDAVKKAGIPRALRWFKIALWGASAVGLTIAGRWLQHVMPSLYFYILLALLMLATVGQRQEAVDLNGKWERIII